MSRQAKTQHIINQAYEILQGYNPMTLRQVYYQLVSRQVIENSRSAYQGVSNALVDARLEGLIPWTWLEDRLRRPSIYSGYKNPAHFAQVMKYRYYRDIWPTQPRRFEAWLEKDALSGIFTSVCSRYNVTLNVGRGYDGWDSIHNAAERYGTGENWTILYYGDFDPSGDDMVRSLRERLGQLNSFPTIIKIALSMDDVTRYNLPPNLTKPTDSRRAAFVAKHGDVSVELDALPPTVLEDSLQTEIEKLMDMSAFHVTEEQEEKDRVLIEEALQAIS
jgi:hypothetical protein